MKKVKRNKGITMIEVLIVVAVIAVLALLVVPNISEYIKDGKERYDDKLVNQLEVSGKNFFSENKSELPKKNYLTIDNVAYSHISLSTLQSKNYVSKDFVDSRGEDCSKESYVYVLQNSGSTENEYHTCLICGEGKKRINYTENDAYCHLENWEDTTAPTCGTNDVQITGGTTKNGIRYNPTSIKITPSDDSSVQGQNGKITYIKFGLYDASGKLVKEKNIKVSNNNDKIKDLNLANYYFKDKDGKVITGNYKIIVLDSANNSTVCGGSALKMMVDKIKPSCKIKDIQNSKDEKYIHFVDTKDDYTSNENLKVLIKKNDTIPDDSVYKTNVNTYKYDLRGKTDGTYYGFVKDEAGNVAKCSADVTINMFPDEAPYCEFTKGPKPKLLKANEKSNLTLECYVDESLSSKYDNSKIGADLGYGKVNVSDATKNKNNKDRTDYSVVYTAKDKKAGKDRVNVLSGFLAAGNQTNSLVQSKDLEVDSIKPVITVTPSKKPADDGSYKVSDSDPLNVVITCSDTGSGVKTFIVNGKTVSGTSKTITFKKANKPYKITASCTDKAGNDATPVSKDIYTKVYSPDPSCGVKEYKTCRTKGCGCEQYKKCRTSACGCEQYKRGSSCGCEKYDYCTASACGCSYYNRCKAAGCASYKTEPKYSYSWSAQKKTNRGKPGNTTNSCSKPSHNGKNKIVKKECYYYGKNQIECQGWLYYYKTCKVKTTYDKVCDYYNRGSVCGCASYNSCRTSACGCDYYKRCKSAGCNKYKECRSSSCDCNTYKSCAHKDCGVKEYKSCWHY